MGPVALLTLTGLFVGLEAAELTDNRCFQGKNMTWPEDECNSVIIAGFTCFGSSCPYNVLMNVSLPENVSVEMFRVKFDDACDCSCHCNCNRSQLGVFRFPVKSSESGVIHAESLEHQMDGGCYQYLSSTHNISSCCILFPGNDYFGKRPDLNNAVKPDRKEPAGKENDKNKYYWGLVVIVVLLFVVLHYFWKKNSSMSIVPMPQQDIELSNSPSAGTPSSKAEKNKHIVIIYANCKETTRKLIGKLIKGFESTLKDCTVSDYTKIGSLLERDIHWLYTGNTFDKAMVLLSPEVSSLLQCNAENIAHDFYSRFVYHFFTKYLLDPHSKDKIIFISFEKEPCLDLNFCSFSTVYALPTKLRDLLQLFDLKGDDSVIKEFESNLR